MTPHVWKGAWSSTAAYNAFDVVTTTSGSVTSSWLALVNNSNVTPVSGATWSLLPAPLLWPTMRGLTWDVKLAPEFFGEEQKSVAPGYDTELSYGPDPLYHFECNFDVLRESAGFNERRTIQNFFESRQGRSKSFLVSLPTLTQNPDDGVIAGQALTVDANNYAPLIIARPYTPETVYEVAGVNGNPGTAPVIKVGGVVKTAGVDYNIIWGGVATSSTSYPGLVVQFLSTPSGAVTADFTWYYRVKFEQTKQEMNTFAWLLWECKQVQFVSTRIAN